MQEFDPYHLWLGIPPHEQPPTLYRLLGIADCEANYDVIAKASDRQIDYVKQYASGQHRHAADHLLQELAKAQLVLLNPTKKKQYDISIQQVTEVSQPVPMPAIVPATPRIQQKQNYLPLIAFAAAGFLAFVLALVLGFWWALTYHMPPRPNGCTKFNCGRRAQFRPAWSSSNRGSTAD